MSAKTLYEKLVESHTIRELDNEGHVGDAANLLI